MDSDAVRAILELLTHGGSAAAMIAVWFVSRAAKSATDAVETLKRIEANNLEAARLLEHDRREVGE